MEKVLMIVMMFNLDGTYNHKYVPFDSYKACYRSLHAERKAEKIKKDDNILSVERFCVDAKSFENLINSSKIDNDSKKN